MPVMNAQQVFEYSSIVIVDDTPTNVALVERVLRDAGAPDIRAFTDPREALTFCTEPSTRPDLVLLDLHMPHVSGLQFMDLLREALPAGSFLPVIVLTADITDTARREVLAAGAKDFLTKPFNVSEILLRTRNVLETRLLYRSLEEHNIQLQEELAAWNAAAREAEERRADLRTAILETLGSKSFEMVFQPIADLHDGTVVGAEALTRFTTEPYRPPNIWFAEATSVGLGGELELGAVEAAFGQLDVLPPEAFLSVNVSPATAVRSELLAAIEAVPSGRVVVELTEHDRVEDYDVLAGSLEDLRGAGARIAVDDTGAGYASLEHILRLRADILKLDITLTRSIDVDPVRRSLAAALVEFAHDTGAQIVAEGVENGRELSVLRDLGVRWAQGYHLGRPASLPLIERATID